MVRLHYMSSYHNPNLITQQALLGSRDAGLSQESLQSVNTELDPAPSAIQFLSQYR